MGLFIKKILLIWFTLLSLIASANELFAMSQAAVMAEEMGTVFARRLALMSKPPIRLFHTSPLVGSPVVRRYVYKDAGREGLKRRWMTGGRGQAAESWESRLRREIRFIHEYSNGFKLLGAGITAVVCIVYKIFIDPPPPPKPELLPGPTEDLHKYCNLDDDKKGAFILKDRLKNLRKKVDDKLTIDCPTIFIHGPGGAGKTTLVHDVLVDVHREKGNSAQHIVRWLDYGDAPSTLDVDIIKFANVLEPVAKVETVEDAYSHIRKKLAKMDFFIISFDNVDSVAFVTKRIEKMKPPGESRGLFLVTSRNERYGTKPDGWEMYPLGPLDLSEAKEMLLYALKEMNVDGVMAEKLIEAAGKSTLCEDLDWLASRVREKKPETYLRDATNPYSFEELEPGTRKLLYNISLVNPVKIPRDLLELLCDDGREALNHRISVLLERKILEVDVYGRYSIHQNKQERAERSYLSEDKGNISRSNWLLGRRRTTLAKQKLLKDASKEIINKCGNVDSNHYPAVCTELKPHIEKMLDHCIEVNESEAKSKLEKILKRIT
jgi:hypothetical protein